MQPGKHIGTAHATDDQLLAYLDGEMKPAARLTTEKHLAGCWACRGRVEELSGEIQAFMQAREQILPAPEVLENAPLEQFRARLQRHAAESETQRPFAARLALGLRRYWAQAASGVSQHRRATLAVVTTVIFTAVALLDVFTTPLSAETVLSRSQAYESSHVPAPGRVRISSVRVEKISLSAHPGASLGMLQVAQDSASPEVAFGSATATTPRGTVRSLMASALDPVAETGGLLRRDPVTASLPEPVLSYLSAEHWLPEVSAREFRKLVQDRHSDATSSKKLDREIELRYPFAPGHVSGITEAILRVDRETYAPHAMSMRTSESTGNWEYRFTAVDDSTAERTPQWAGVFGSLPALAENIPSRRDAPIPSLPPATPLSYAQSTATEKEILVSETLHRLDICLGEEAYVLPMSDGSLMVQAILDQTSKRDALRAALRQLPFPVGTRLYLTSELQRNPQLFDSPFSTGPGAAATSLTAPVTLADFSNQQTVIYSRLAQLFTKQGLPAEEADRKVAEVSNEIVTLSRQTLLHAWALRRLNQEFDARRTLGLPVETLQQIDRLRADHRKWIASLARHQMEMLAGLGEGPAVPAGVSRPLADPELIELAGQLNTAVRSLFAVSGGPSGADPGLQRLVAVLQQLER